jgi:hypothetical protein
MKFKRGSGSDWLYSDPVEDEVETPIYVPYEGPSTALKVAILAATV